MPTFTQTDLNVSHTFRVGERLGIKLEATAINLFNQATVISRVTQMNWNGNITRDQLPLTNFFNGYNLSDYVRPGHAHVQRHLRLAWRRSGGWRFDVHGMASHPT